MARHHPDLIMCRKRPGIAIGRLCEKCARRPARYTPASVAHRCVLSDPREEAPPSAALTSRNGASRPLAVPTLVAGDGKCVICDSYVRPATLVRICDECNYGSYQARALRLAAAAAARAHIACALLSDSVEVAPVASGGGSRGRTQGRCVICGGLGVSDAY